MFADHISYHWEQSLTRIKKIHTIVPPYMVQTFEKLCSSISSCSSQTEYNDSINQIVNLFPKAKRWIAWWSRESIACLIFKSQMKMSEELCDKLPRTNNGIEAMHSYLYKISDDNHSIYNGFSCLALCVISFEICYNACLKGIQIKKLIV
jgi:hypothetical protein